jgi:DNA (cytosine-5)-methyltransferase 1
LNNTSPISAFYLTPAAQRSEAVISCVDLFCGIGGLTHGLALAGVSVVAGIDNDPDSQFAYQTNNTSRFLLSDVASLSPSQLRNLWPKRSITLLAGCAPCQPFSTYSQKSQSNRRQSDWALVSTFGNLIAETKPDLVSMENVPHLQHHRVFQQLLTALSSYHVFWSVVECSGYGVPQTRKRLVLLASRFGPIQLGIPSNSAPPTVRSAIEHVNSVKKTCGESKHPCRVVRGAIGPPVCALHVTNVQAASPIQVCMVGWNGTLLLRQLQLSASGTETDVLDILTRTAPLRSGKLRFCKPSRRATTFCAKASACGIAFKVA